MTRRFQLLFADMPGRSTFNQRRYASGSSGSFASISHLTLSALVTVPLWKSLSKQLHIWCFVLYPSQWYASPDEAFKVISPYDKREKSPRTTRLKGKSELFSRKNTVVFSLGLCSYALLWFCWMCLQRSNSF